MKYKSLSFILVGIMSFGLGLSPLFAIEKPAFQSILKDGKFEIRRYPELKVVSSPMPAMAQDNQSFRSLFRYISGNNQAQQKIDMTSPVIMDEGKEGKMRFVLPKETVKAGAPEALDPQIKVESLKGGDFAVLRFSNGDEAQARTQAVLELKKQVEAKGKQSEGQPFFAFYDPPFKPNFLSTFEVWIRLKP